MEQKAGDFLRMRHGAENARTRNSGVKEESVGLDMVAKDRMIGGKLQTSENPKWAMLLNGEIE